MQHDLGHRRIAHADLPLKSHHPELVANELETLVVEATNEALLSYGLALVRMGNFDISLSVSKPVRFDEMRGETRLGQLRR